MEEYKALSAKLRASNWNDIEITSLWTLLWNLTSERAKFFRFQTLLLQFPPIHELLRENNPKFIETELSAVTSETIERSALLFAYMNMDNAERMIRAAIEWLGQDMSPNVVEKLEKLDNIEVDILTSDVRHLIFRIVKEKSNDLPALLFLAPIVGAVACFVSESSQFIHTKIIELLSSDAPMSKVVGCVICERLGDSLEFVSDLLFDNLVNCLVTPGEWQYRAHKAMRRLIQTGYLASRRNVDCLVDLFTKCNPNDRPRFVKLFLRYFDEIELVSPDIVMPITAFVITNFIKECSFRHELLGVLSAIPLPKDAARSIKGSVLECCHDVFQKKRIAQYPDALAVLYNILNHQAELSVIPDLVAAAEFLSDESAPLKTRIGCALWLADFCDSEEAPANVEIQTTIPKRIEEFVCVTVENLEPCNLVCLIATIMVNHGSVLKAMSSEGWIKIFTRFEALVRKENVSNRLNVELEVIKKISDHIPDSHKSQLVELLLKGEIEYLSGLPACSIDGDSMLLHFIGSYVKKSTLPCNDILSQLVDLIPFTTQQMLVSLLDPLEVALQVEKLTEETAKSVFDNLVESLSIFNMSDEVPPDSAVTVFGFLSTLCKNFHSLDVDTLLKKTQALLERDEYKERGMEPVAFAEAVSLTCQIFVIKNICDEELINEFLEQLSLEESVAAPGLTEQIIESLSAMCHNEVFLPVHRPILKFFIEGLLDEWANAGVSQELLDKMKQTVKSSLAANSELKRHFAEEFPRNLQSLLK